MKRGEEEIKADIKAAYKRIDELKAEMDAWLLQGVTIKPGDTVRVKNGRYVGQIFRVTRIRSWVGQGTASVHGAPIRKDGQPAKREKWIGTDREVELIAWPPEKQHPQLSNQI